MDQNKINIILFMAIILLGYLLFKAYDKINRLQAIEQLANLDMLSDESVQNIAGLFNEGTLKVTNLKTVNLEVSGNATVNGKTFLANLQTK